MLAGSLTACSGSSHGPALARADAKPLSALAGRIAHEGACAQRRDIATLQRRTVTLINARRVPAQLQESLMSGVDALAADAPPCVAAVPAQATTPTTSVHPVARTRPRPHPHGPPPPPRDHHGHHDHGPGGHHH